LSSIPIGGALEHAGKRGDRPARNPARLGIRTETNKIFAECCTLKKTSSGQGRQFWQTDRLRSGLIASNMVGARRAEVVTCKALTHLLRHDSLFVVMKTKVGWRIDSKKIRYIGLPDWRNDIL
jgi:hypothetical protein